MKIILTGILCFGIWATGTTYWYLCKIENMCPGETSNKIIASNTETTPLEKDDITTSSSIDEPKEIDSLETENKDSLEFNIDTLSMNPESNVLDEDKGITEKMVFHFDFASTNIQQDLTKNESFLNLITYLTENIDKKIIITGHTDDIGDDANNLKLGQERATTVKELLQSKKIASSRIEARSMGEYEPLTSNQTEEGRQTNRRVEILIQ